MNDDLRKFLGDLENRIKPSEEDALFEQWLDFSEGRFVGGYFFPQRSGPNPPTIEWPQITVNAALDDFDLMALQQYHDCSMQLERASGSLLNVRCNYGTSIIPLLFGVEPFVMDELANTLPTSHPLQDKEAIRKLVSAGVPDLHRGYGARVLEMGERFAAIGKQYPHIGHYVQVYHPDLQGPMDICEIVWGSALFLELYDEPQLVHDFLSLIVETYCAFMRAWENIHPFKPEGSTHWGLFFKGAIMLRDDSATNFSRRMFDEFILPYDQALLDRFGGGAVHFCGKGDHFIAALNQLRGLHAVNISQPELNNMVKIFSNTIDQGIKIIGFDRAAAEKAIASGVNLQGLVHCYEDA